MPTKLPDYKGFEIELDDNGTFRAAQGSLYHAHNVVEAKTLETLKTKINDLLKASFGQAVWTEVDAWDDDRLSYRKGTVKSVRENKQSRGAPERSWTVEFGKSERYDRTDYAIAHQMFKDTPENLERFEKAKALTRERKRITEELDKVKKSFERYTDEELLGLPPKPKGPK